MARQLAMSALGNGLGFAGHHEDALSVQEAELSMQRRLGTSAEEHILNVQGNLANSYQMLGRDEEALAMRRDLYSGFLKLNGDEHRATLHAASDALSGLLRLQRFRRSQVADAQNDARDAARSPGENR